MRSTHFNFYAFMTVDPSTRPTNTLRLNLTTFCDNPGYDHLSQLIYSPDTPYSVSYFNAFEQHFQGDQVVLVAGTFVATPRENEHPSFLILAQLMVPIPEIPDNPVPQWNPRTSFVGNVTGRHTGGSGIRIFYITLTVFAGRQDNQNQFATFQTACAIPNTQRWARTQLPQLHRPIQVSGELIGAYPTQNEPAPCILVHNISYINTSREPPSAPTNGPSNPPTPSGRRRRPALGATTTSPTKKQQGPSSTPLPTQQEHSSTDDPQEGPSSIHQSQQTPPTTDNSNTPDEPSSDNPPTNPSATPASRSSTRGRSNKGKAPAKDQ